MNVDWGSELARVENERDALAAEVERLGSIILATESHMRALTNTVLRVREWRDGLSPTLTGLRAELDAILDGTDDQ